MEHFELPDNIKQKSVYHLNLDPARVILISAVVIGIIIASFLFGMNYIKKEPNKDSSMMGNSLSMQFNDKNGDMLDNKLSNSDNDVLKPDNEKILKEKDNKDTKDKKDDSRDLLSNLKDNDKNLDDKNSKDMLSKEKIQDIIPTDDNVSKSKKKYKNTSRSKDEQKIAHKKKDQKEFRKTKKKKKLRRNSNVVEVADDQRSFTKKKSSGSHYNIQIASYDKRSKAQKEVQKLKELDYEAHIDRKIVDEKRYYRVRIGPITSKKKALQLLNKVQENRRYENSYMIKE